MWLGVNFLRLHAPFRGNVTRRGLVVLVLEIRPMRIGTP